MRNMRMAILGALFAAGAAATHVVGPNSAYAASCRFVAAITEAPSEGRARQAVQGKLLENARDRLRSRAVFSKDPAEIWCSGHRADPDNPGVEIFGCVAVAWYCTVRVPRPFDRDINPPPRAAPDLRNPRVLEPDNAAPLELKRKQTQ